MDLLHQILARLSLERIDQLRLGDDSLRLVIRNRMRVVNRLSDTVSSADDYRRVCFTQGEYQTSDPDFGSFMLARAAFLRDKDAYLRFSRMFPCRFDLDRALRSDVPEIQAMALARQSTSTSGGFWPFLVKHPDLIRWTKGLLKIFRQIPNPTEMMNPFLLGYLDVPVDPEVWDVVEYRDYLLGQLERINPETTFVASPEIDDILLPGFQQMRVSTPMQSIIYVRSGYFPPRLFTLAVSETIFLHAIEYIQPDLVEHLLRVDPELTFDRFFLQVFSVSDAVVRRARKMIAVATARFPGRTDYLLQLQIICGDRFDEPDQLTPDLARLVIDVMHPQLRNVLSKSRQYTVYTHQISPVHYDCVDGFRYIAEFESSIASYQFEDFYQLGQLYKLPKPDIEVLLSRYQTFSLGLHGAGPKEEVQYQRILKILTDG